MELTKVLLEIRAEARFLIMAYKRWEGDPQLDIDAFSDPQLLRFLNKKAPGSRKELLPKNFWQQWMMCVLATPYLSTNTKLHLLTSAALRKYCLFSLINEWH